MQKIWKMTETLAHGYSSESAQRELSNEYQHDRVLDVFEKSLHPCAMDGSSLSSWRVKNRLLCYIPVHLIQQGNMQNGTQTHTRSERAHLASSAINVHDKDGPRSKAGNYAALPSLDEYGRYAALRDVNFQSLSQSWHSPEPCVNISLLAVRHSNGE